MRQLATVVSLLPDGRALLTVERKSACSGDCHRCSGCGAATETIRFAARNPIGAEPGAEVWVETESRPVLLAAALVYALPLALLLAVYLLVTALGGRSLLPSAAAFAVGLVPAFWLDRRLRQRPPVSRIVSYR